MSQRVPSGLSMAFVAAVVSGFAVYVNGLAVTRFDDATTYTTAKNAIAGVILLALAGAASQPSTPTASARRSLAVVAVVGGSVPFVLFFEGLQRASSTDAAFIHKTMVVWVAVGATLALGERVTMVHAGAIGLLLAGHLLVAGSAPTAYGSGEVMIAAATLLWTAEILVVKTVLGSVPSGLAAASRMCGGALLLIAWAAMRGGLADLVAFDRTQWAWLALTGVTLAAFVSSWYRALALAPAIDVTAVLVLGAVITGALNVAFRGVPVTADSFGYLLLLAGGLAVALRRPAPRPRWSA